MLKKYKIILIISYDLHKGPYIKDVREQQDIFFFKHESFLFSINLKIIQYVKKSHLNSHMSSHEIGESTVATTRSAN